MTHSGKTGMASAFYVLNGLCLILFSLFAYGSDYESVFGLVAVLGIVALPAIALLTALLLIAVIISVSIKPSDRALLFLAVLTFIDVGVVIFLDMQVHFDVFIVITAVYGIMCIVGPFLPLNPNKANVVSS